LQERPFNAVSAARSSGYLSAKAVGSFVPRLTKKAFEKYGFSAAVLITDWSSIAGAELASYTVPERLKWPRTVEAYGDVEDGAQGRPGATLMLRVDPVRALDVEYKSAQIIDRINAYFGYRAVCEMRVLQGAVPAVAKGAGCRQAEALLPAAPAATSPLQGIADQALGIALSRMQAGVQARSRPA
jgi:hypothetical protein